MYFFIFAICEPLNIFWYHGSDNQYNNEQEVVFKKTNIA